MSINSKIRRGLTRALELPAEAIMDLPVITLTGSEEICIENYRAIIEYGEEKIRISTACGALRIRGARLTLKRLATETIIICGSVTSLEFII